MPNLEPELAHIEKLSATYAGAHAKLAKRAGKLRERVTALHLDARAELKTLADSAANARAELGDAIAAAPHLFAQPKTRTFSGVKVGLRKKKGEVIIHDAEKTVALIHKNMDEATADILLRRRETPDKTAIAEHLNGAQLKTIAVEIRADGEIVVIDTGDKEMERFIRGLIKDAAEAEGLTGDAA